MRQSEFGLLTPIEWALVIKNSPANAGEVMLVRSLGREDPLEEGTETHSSILACIFLPGEFHEQRSLAGYSP